MLPARTYCAICTTGDSAIGSWRAADDRFSLAGWIIENSANLGDIPSRLVVARRRAGVSVTAATTQATRDGGRPRSRRSRLPTPKDPGNIGLLPRTPMASSSHFARDVDLSSQCRLPSSSIRALIVRHAADEPAPRSSPPTHPYIPLDGRRVARGHRTATKGDHRIAALLRLTGIHRARESRHYG